MNPVSRLLKTSEISKYKNIYRYNKIPRPATLKVKKKKPLFSFLSRDSSNKYYGFPLLAIPISTFFLGTWQIQRLKWKLNLIKGLENRIHLEPRYLPDDLNELKTMEYIPVRVKGKYLHDREFTIGPRSLITDGINVSEKKKQSISSSAGPGYVVITPFKVEDRDLTILVNRGWVSGQYKDPSMRPLGQIEGVQEITGLVRLSESKPLFVPANNPDDNRWYYRNVEEMAHFTGTDPVFIDLTPAERLPETPISGQTRISMRNEHLTYIITWYSLSLITGYLWYRQFVKKLPIF